MVLGRPSREKYYMHRIALGRSHFGAGVINFFRVVGQITSTHVLSGCPPAWVLLWNSFIPGFESISGLQCNRNYIVDPLLWKMLNTYMAEL